MMHITLLSLGRLMLVPLRPRRGEAPINGTLSRPQSERGEPSLRVMHCLLFGLARGLGQPG